MTEKLLNLKDPIESMILDELRRAEAIGMAMDAIFYNRGARLADDCFCQSCGVRGYTTCPSCSDRMQRESGR